MATNSARRALVGLALVGAFGTIGTAFAPAAHAAGTTITVTTTSDDSTVDGNCSLREALQAANTDHAVDTCPAGNGADTIVLGPSTYTLTNYELDVQATVTIQGAGAASTVIDDQSPACTSNTICTRAVLVAPSADLTMSGVTIRNAPNSFFVQGTLDLSDSTIDSAGASCGTRADDAGAIQNQNTVHLERVHIGHTGDAIFNALAGHFVADGLTMFANGPCEEGQSIYNFGAMTLTNAIFDADIDRLDYADSINNFAVATLTIRGSRFMHNTGGIGSAIIDNDGTATITDSAFDQNQIVPIRNNHTLTIRRTRFSTNGMQYYEPGAIENTSGAHLEMTASTVDHNVGASGGGITNDRAGHVTLVNDTITDNAALYGPWSQFNLLPSGGIANKGVMLLRNVTVARNRALGYRDWRYHAGGIVTMPGGYTALSNTIVSDNVVQLPMRAPDCFGAIHSLGYNLVEDTSECQLGPFSHNRYGVSARLYALADFGGPTMTSMPPWDSLATDLGNPATPDVNDATTCSPFDQRGIARPRDGDGNGAATCDIGAVER
jgi:CSLREA domain-containing protein